jgi:hypothetical protein
MSARRIIADRVARPRKPAQPPDRFSGGRGLGHGLDLAIPLAEPGERLLEGEERHLERALQRGDLEALAAEPRPMRPRPVPTGEIAPPVSIEKCHDAVLPAEHVPAQTSMAVSSPARNSLTSVRASRWSVLIHDGRHRYTLTDLGYRVVVYCTKRHQRLITPILDSLEAAAWPAVARSAHPVDRALTGLNDSFDYLAEVSGLKFAA